MNSIQSTTKNIPILLDNILHPLYFEVVTNRVVVGVLGCRRLGLMENFNDIYEEELTSTADGLLDITLGSDVPLFVSQPHFYSKNAAAQKKWVDQFDGLQVGNEDKHSSFIDVHSQTGRAVSSQVKLQFSIKLPPKAGAFTVLNTIPGAAIDVDGDEKTTGDPLIMPVFWIHKDMNLTTVGNEFLFSRNVR